MSSSLELTRLNNMMDDNKSIASNTGMSTASSSSSRGSYTVIQRMAIVLVMLLCIMAFSMKSFPEVIDHYSYSQGKIVAKTDDLVTGPLLPRKELISGEHHYYMLPKTPYNTKPLGVLIVLHSCQRSGLEFFHLPEDRIVAQDALQKGLAVLALTSQDRESGCFTKKDLSWVKRVVNEWTMLHMLDKVPRFGLASSSGASFLFFVYKELKLTSMAVYNTPQNFLPDDLEDQDIIPTAFVTMPLDKPMTRQIRKNHDELVRAGFPTQLFRVSPRPFTQALCAARLSELDSKECSKMFDVLQKDHAHLLDKDGFVAQDWKSGQWQALLESLGLDSKTTGLPYLTTQASSGHSWIYAAMEQEIRTCQAYHGMTSEHHSSVLDFLIAQAESDSETPGGG